MPEKINVSKILVQNDKGEFLAVQKSDDYDWKAGKWELPGGKIEEGEDRFEAGKRELKLEVGLETDELIDLVRIQVEEFSGNKPVVVCWMLYTESFSGKIKLSGEHQDYRWVSSEEFMDLDWHRDAGYEIPVMENIDEYLE